MRSRLLAVSICVLGLLVQASSATTWFIKPDGTGDAPTIQAAVQSASPGDTLLLSTGTFSGPGNCDVLIGKPLVITSVLGRDSTVIDCPGQRGFDIRYVTLAPLVLRGITIQNASLGDVEEVSGDGILVNDSFLRIEDAAIKSCGGQWTYGGAGMAAYNSQVEMVSTLWRSNFAPTGGGGHILVSGGTLVADNCEFLFGDTHYADPGGGAILIGALTDVVITNSNFVSNSSSGRCCGGAIYSSGSLVIRDCFFDGNYSDGGGAIFGTVDSLLNSAFHNNTTRWGYRGSVLLGDAGYVAGNWFIQNIAYDGPQTSSIFEGTIEVFENNIVVNDGWYMSVLNGSAERIQNNTFFLAGPPDDSHERFLLSDTTLFANNIFYDTVPTSVMFNGSAGAKVACSDIYIPTGSVGPAFVDQGGNIGADPRFCLSTWDSDFTLTTASPCIPENSPCGALIGARQTECTECPADTTLGIGARRLLRFPLLNPGSTAETCIYLIQCNEGLMLVADDSPGDFTTVLGGNRVLGPHETAAIPVWVSVNADATPGDSLRVWISQTLLGPLAGSYGCETIVTISGTSVSIQRTPVRPTLRQNWPNPFNPNTTIAFTIPTGSGPAALTVYDIGGRVVRRLGDYPPGMHTTRWDGRNGRGSPVASGIYLYRLEGADFSITRRMVLLR